MPNRFYRPKNYPLMYKNERIGTLKVDMDESGEYVYSLNLRSRLEPRLIPIAIRGMQMPKVVNGSMPVPNPKRVKKWLDSRIFPRDRQNKEELLNRIGIPTYDEIKILEHTNGSVPHDDYWIKFRPDNTYENTVAFRRRKG